MLGNLPFAEVPDGILQCCGICAFPRCLHICPRAANLPNAPRVAVSHSELRISFYSAIKKYFQSKIRALKLQMPPSGLPQFFWVFRRFAYIFRRPLNVRGAEIGKRGRAFFLVCALPLRILFAPVSGFPIKITAS